MAQGHNIQQGLGTQEILTIDSLLDVVFFFFVSVGFDAYMYIKKISNITRLIL